jgi:hypothetical protein
VTSETYQDYTVRGLAKPLADGTFEASGGVEKGRQLLQDSGPLGYPTFELAIPECLAWAKAWVESHG